MIYEKVSHIVLEDFYIKYIYHHFRQPSNISTASIKMYFFTPVVIKNTVQSKMYGERLSAHPCTRLMGQTVSSEEAPSRMDIYLTMYVRHVLIPKIKLFKGDLSEGQSSRSSAIQLRYPAQEPLLSGLQVSLLLQVAPLCAVQLHQVVCRVCQDGHLWGFS